MALCNFGAILIFEKKIVAKFMFWYSQVNSRISDIRCILMLVAKFVDKNTHKTRDN